MSFIRKAVDTAIKHANSIRRLMSSDRNLIDRLSAAEADIQKLRLSIGSPQHLPYSGSELVLLMLTELKVTNRWEARKLQRKDDGTVWEFDDEDDRVYRVMPVPGMRGEFFPGCTCLCALSHLEEYLGEDPDGSGPLEAPVLERGVYIPVQGECFGFLATITGSELVGGGTEEDARQYHWEQVGVDAADKYTHESNPLDGIIPGAQPLGLAIHQQQAWMGLDDGVQPSRRSLTGHVVQMWYSGGAFRFSSPREIFGVVCEGEEP